MTTESADGGPRKASNRRRVLLLAGVLLLLWLSAVAMRVGFSRVDYERVRRGERPVFAWADMYLGDGGTVVYQGLGYRLVAQRRFHVENGMPTGYDRGPILTYELNWLLLPQADRSEIRFEPY